jgi:UDP-sugar pyrophosphorylase
VAPEGDVNDVTTGLSPYPGNINTLLFRLDPYLRTIRRTGGIMGEFVNPKYADEQKLKFKKPTRLECMMQDYPKVLPPGARVGFTSAPAWLVYSPCKNNTADAAASVAAGVPAGCALTAESDQLHVHAELLSLLGAKVGQGATQSYLGISAPLLPALVLHPSFAIYASELTSRFPTPERVSISSRSSLVVSGNVIIESLSLDGALLLEAGPGSVLLVRAGHHKIINEGLQISAASVSKEIIAMRGYVFIKAGEERAGSTGEGTFVYTGRAVISEAAYDFEAADGADMRKGAIVSCLSCC